MNTWLLSRIVSAVIALIVTFIITDSLILFLPGDPLELLMEETGSTLDPKLILESTRMHLGTFDRIKIGIVSLFHLDFGYSLLSGQKIFPLLYQRTLNSVLLALSVLSSMVTLAVILAPLSAVLERQNQKTYSRLISLWGWFSNSVSTVWIGPILLITLSLWIPIANPTESYFLAWLTLTILMSGGALRIVRERVRESVTHGSVRGAMALGFGNLRIAFKNGFLPVGASIVGFWGTQFGALMAGAFISEVLFGLNGLGSFLVDSVLKRDFPVIQASLFASTGLCILGNLMGDLAQRWLDPRLRGNP